MLVLTLSCGALLGSHVSAAWPSASDAAELTLCAVSGGVPHPPGYPLWTWLGRAALWLPTGLHPVETLSWMGIGMACLAALFSRAFLRAYGVPVWSATAAAVAVVAHDVGTAGATAP